MVYSGFTVTDDILGSNDHVLHPRSVLRFYSLSWPLIVRVNLLTLSVMVPGWHGKWQPSPCPQEPSMFAKCLYTAKFIPLHSGFPIRESH